MNDTPNLALPYILPSQAQKHVTHNEAIRALDCLVQLAVESRTLAAPPESPAEGSRYLVAHAATGDWAGQSEKIAAFQDGAWAFYEPKEGWIAWVSDQHELAIYSAGTWASFSGGSGEGDGGTGDPGDITELDNLVHLGINATADATNRLALKSPASLFDNVGNGHQQKINKHAAGDTASVLYQTNYSGRAEMGLAGDDDFHFKVSPDGATWYEAIKIDRNSGYVSFPKTRPPAFSASKSVSQTGIANSVLTQITFDTEDFDVGSHFASNAWTPPAGTVLIVANLALTGDFPSGALASIAIYKNGSVYRRSNLVGVVGSGAFPGITMIEVANGTDTYTVSCLLAVSSGTVTCAATPATYFQGFWLSP